MGVRAHRVERSLAGSKNSDRFLLEEHEPEQNMGKKRGRWVAQLRAAIHERGG